MHNSTIYKWLYDNYSTIKIEKTKRKLYNQGLRYEVTFTIGNSREFTAQAYLGDDIEGNYKIDMNIKNIFSGSSKSYIHTGIKGKYLYCLLKPLVYEHFTKKNCRIEKEYKLMKIVS